MTGVDGSADRLRSRTTSAVAWTVVDSWSSRLLSLAVFAVLTRLLDPTDFGVVTMATVAVALLTVVVDAGFAKAIVQRPNLQRHEVDTLFWSSVALALLVYGALFVSAPALASAFGEPQLGPVLRVVGLTLVLSALSSAPAALLERDLDFRALALRRLAGNLVGGLVSLPMAFAGAGVWALVAQFVLSAAASSVVLWVRSPWRPHLRFSYRVLRETLPFSMGSLGVDLLLAFQANVDKALVGAFFDARVLGYYFVAQRAVGITLELATSVLGRVALSVFSRIQDDVARTNRVLRKLTFAAGAVAFPVFGLLAVLAADLLPVLVGHQWDASVPIFQAMAAGAAIAAVTYFDNSVLIAAGRPGKAFQLGVVQNVVGAGLLVAAAPLGPVAVALSRLLMRIVVWPVRMHLLHRYAGVVVGPYLEQVARPAVGLVVALPLAFGLRRWLDGAPDLLAAAAAGTVALLAYLAVTWWLAGTENRRAAASLVRDVRSRRRRTDREVVAA